MGSEHMNYKYYRFTIYIYIGMQLFKGEERSEKCGDVTRENSSDVIIDMGL